MKPAFANQITVRHALSLSLISFFMHLAWEYGQCGGFVHANVLPTPWAMVRASLGDVGITWGLYGLLALRNKQWLWLLERWRAADALLLAGLSVVVQIIVERHALSIGSWSYTPSNPRVPGTDISALPLLQMLVLTPIIFAMARRFSLRIRT